MTQLSISIEGVDIVRQGLQDLQSEVPKIGRLGIYRMEQTVMARMKEYWTMNQPPELPSYQRTGRLAGGWWITSNPDGYTLSNNVPYTKYVHGNAYGLEQAWMHAKPGRHRLLRDVVEEEVAKQPQEIDDAIKMVARRI